ncbi:MAG TPA: hypothetical protein VHQ70_10185 [Syntrophomonadaceae bacterium]|nr:hypothetical protein [Syntrophomonadaceae bacterium]
MSSRIKTHLREQGFNPAEVNDPLYFLDPRTGRYLPLTREIYEDIIEQRIAF